MLCPRQIEDQPTEIIGPKFLVNYAVLTPTAQPYLRTVFETAFSRMMEGLGDGRPRCLAQPPLAFSWSQIKDSKLPSRSSTKVKPWSWTPEEEKLMLELRASGMRPLIIARKLGRTEVAIVNRLGLLKARASKGESPSRA
jgi:hypothetical protein